MAKRPRAIAAGVPHHIVQRGNRRQTTFFRDQDYVDYIELLAEHCAANEVKVWAWCLMPNHVHIVAAPQSADGLSKAIGDAQRRYSWAVNRRHGWRGSLWQDRFRCCAMDEPHTIMAMRYVERNPDRANLVKRPEDWRWSSARAHLGLVDPSRHDDPLTDLSATRPLISDWRSYLHDTPPSWQVDNLRRSTGTGRPIGEPSFVERLESELGRRLRPQKRGPAAKRDGRKG